MFLDANFIINTMDNKNMDESNFDIRINNSNWVQRKKLILYVIFMLIVFFISVYGFSLYQKSKIVAPSCIDGVRNQNEGGIDCEGECVKICREHMSEIKVLYAKAIPSGYDTYDLMAMIENNNVGKAPNISGHMPSQSGQVDAMPYTFKIYNKAGIEINRYTGKVNIPDAIKMPIIIPNIQIIKNDNIRVTFELDKYDMYTVVTHEDKVKVMDYKFDEDKKRLFINLVNNTLDNSGEASVKVTISDSADEVKAIGQTLVPAMASGEKRQVTITWSDPLLETLNKNSRVQIYLAPYKI